MAVQTWYEYIWGIPAISTTVETSVVINADASTDTIAAVDTSAEITATVDPPPIILKACARLAPFCANIKDIPMAVVDEAELHRVISGLRKSKTNAHVRAPGPPRDKVYGLMRTLFDDPGFRARFRMDDLSICI